MHRICQREDTVCVLIRIPDVLCRAQSSNISKRDRFTSIMNPGPELDVVALIVKLRIHNDLRNKEISVLPDLSAKRECR